MKDTNANATKLLKKAIKAADKRIKEGILKEKDKDGFIRGYCRKPSGV